MIINLKQIFDNPGSELPVDFSLDLSDYLYNGSKPFCKPITVKGYFRNRAGIVTLKYSVTSEMQIPCDRCLDLFTLPINIDVEQTVVEHLYSQNDDFLTAPGYELDMSELILNDILLNIPTKVLCSEDCKGLCSKCGANLNHEQCKCGKPEIDPRLSVLSQLLK